VQLTVGLNHAVVQAAASLVPTGDADEDQSHSALSSRTARFLPAPLTLHAALLLHTSSVIMHALAVQMSEVMDTMAHESSHSGCKI
jgi:hypothetical protein